MKDLAPLPLVTPRRDSDRRRWLLGAVAGVAATAGSGLAWWTYRAPESSESAPTGLWQLEFKTPDGATLSMKALLGKPLLLNFWATWCPPCVEELPLLSSFFTENMAKGWQVLGLAIDQAEPVKRFLSRAPVKFPVAMASLNGIRISRSLGNSSGGLPFTAVFRPNGQVLQRKLGPLTGADLSAWVASVKIDG